MSFSGGTPSPEEIYGGSYQADISPEEPEGGRFWSIEDQKAQEPPPGAFVPVAKKVDVWDQYDPAWLDTVEGLLYCGKSKAFKIGPHQIVIKMPTSKETLEASKFIGPYTDTAGGLRALTIVTLAICIESVNGNPLPEGMRADGSDTLETRFDWVGRYAPPIIDHIYNQYLILENEVREAIEDLGKEGAPRTAPSSPG